MQALKFLIQFGEKVIQHYLIFSDETCLSDTAETMKKVQNIKKAVYARFYMIEASLILGKENNSYI